MILFNDPDTNNLALSIKSKVDRLCEYANTYPSSATEGLDIDRIPEEDLMFVISNQLFDLCENTLNSTHAELIQLKEKEGSSNEIYLEINDTIASTVAILLKFPISNGNMMCMTSDFKANDSTANQMKKDVERAAKIMLKVRRLETTNLSSQFIKEIMMMISNLEKKLNPSAGCFIASYAYDSYESKEVLTLRIYRDETLSKSSLGRQLIQAYYRYSPRLIKVFGGNKIFKTLIKVILKPIVKSLNKI